MSKTIAVIGCGRIANAAHFPAFEKMGDVRVKYACDIIEEKAIKAKEQYSFVENVITDYKVALADDEVEAVFVLTPNFSHYEITMAALKAGKHVMCEKPVTINYEYSCEMAQEADKQGKMLNIGVCNRYAKAVEELERLNREGRFGNIYQVYCSFRRFRSIPGLGGAFTTKAHSGGGVLIDWGIHFFDLVLYILGNAKLKSVSCDAYCKLAKDMKSYKYTYMWSEETSDVENGINDVDDSVSGYIRTDKGNISFNGAWAQNIKHDEMFVDFMGDKAGARLTYGGGFELYDGDTLETIVPELETADFYYCEDAAFFESIAANVKDKNNIDNILESMKLLDSLYKSSELGKEIVL